MLILFRALGIYRIIIIVWAVMTWIPKTSGGVLHQIHNIVGIPVVPVLNLFSFASFGNIGLQAIVLLAIIWGIENLIEKKLKAEGIDPYATGEQEDNDQEIRRIE